jgi:adenylate cyclase class IV
MRNLEAKFTLTDPVEARRRAEAIGFAATAILIQRDTFFAVPHGRLKLREEPAAMLIHYQRQDARGFDLSDYTIAPVADPESTRVILQSALGIIAEVRKRRTLLLRANIRLHLDEIEQLGTFGEIEIVLDAEHPSPTGLEASHFALREILAALGVRPEDHIGVSYFELMAPAQR